MAICASCGGVIPEKKMAEGGPVVDPWEESEEAESETEPEGAEAEEYEAHEGPVTDQKQAALRMREAAFADAMRSRIGSRAVEPEEVSSPDEEDIAEAPEDVEARAEARRRASFARGGGVFAGFKRKGAR